MAVVAISSSTETGGGLERLWNAIRNERGERRKRARQGNGRTPGVSRSGSAVQVGRRTGDPVVRKPTRAKKPNGTGIRILFVAGFGPIVEQPAVSVALYRDHFGLEFDEIDGYFHTERLEGVKTFALWPLSQAARSCFGTETWPAGVPVPQAWLEFDVENVAQATKALRDRGYRLLVSNRKEPWGQTVSRLLSPEGLLLGVTRTPALRRRQET